MNNSTEVSRCYALTSVMGLEELGRIFSGSIRELGDRRWLDTHVGGLRAFIICRATKDGGATFDLAVFTPSTLELDPLFAKAEGQDWRLEGEHVLPRLKAGFLFTGCRRGILFASCNAEPTLESMVSTLWDLANWAREPWRPTEGSEEAAQFEAYQRASIRRERWIRVAWVVLVVAVVLWLRAGSGPALSALVTLLAAHRYALEDPVAIGHDG